MGNICDQACNCCQCCKCCDGGYHNDQIKSLKITKVQPLPTKEPITMPYRKVHYPQQPQITEVITQDYGDEPHPSIAKISEFPNLTQQQMQVWQRERSTKQSGNLRGTPLQCFFLTKKRIWYEGQWKQGSPHGKGKLLMWSGMFYEGYFNKGYAQSKEGLVIFPEGSYYKGNVLQSRLNGEGFYYNVYNGVTYKGGWKDDKPQGYGQQNFSNGNNYKGQFKDGYKDGKGKFTFRNGMAYDGDFKLGYFWGQGCVQKGKGYYLGKFQRGKKVGKSVQMRTDFGQYNGPLQQGLMHGDGQFLWYDGKKYFGGFSKNQLEGKGRIQYPNGQKVTGVWRYGLNQYIDKISRV